ARTLALAALGAAVGAGTALAAGTMPTGSERPIARPHVAAKMACAKCHEAPENETGPGTGTATATAETRAAAGAPTYAAAGACKTCHAAAKHASERGAHRALAAKGELTCATCHPAHEGAQGVTFGSDGSFVRWGAGAEVSARSRTGGANVKAGVTVPLVSLAVCAKCHDPTSAKDPIARCVPAEVRARQVGAAGTASLCFDEHRSSATAESRAVAWEGAREVATTTAWVGGARPTGSPWLPLGGGLAGAVGLGVSASLLERRKRSKATGPIAAPLLPAARKRLPTINPSTCLGCYACVDACPFDVLAIEKYVAVVIRPDECCGVVLCEQVCPNGSLTITEGEPVLDRPVVDEHLESADVPGLFLAGDLTGLPLIKNAINQGVRAVDRIASTLPKKRTDPVDVIVIGAGPAGLSAALRAQERGLSCVVLEQATVAASVKSFPRDKIVYDPPLDLPVEGELWLKEATKEELVAQWTRIVRARAVDVREGRRVTGIDRADEHGGGFVVTTARDDASTETFRAARVVLAIGRRGTPRELELAIEAGADGHVSYALADARSFAGKRIVIAGLGDAAMEAAIAIARQPETSVTIAYRGSTFTRGKSRNIAEVKELVAKGRLRLLFETVPVAVGKTTVTLAGVTVGKGRRTLPADALLVLVGGVPSWDLLARAGIVRPQPTAERGAPAPDDA
ncbi:MAG: Thioredoxin reductase, partial [Myxococcaceae bacterium]|nr:Thioredoxin reductase [Myxococcaceae bacterium]